MIHYFLSGGRPTPTFTSKKNFVPRAEADDWSAALAATAGPGPRSTLGVCQAPQHAQGLALFETFFHPPS